MNYAVGKMTNVVTMDRDKIEVISWTPKGNQSSVLILDGTEQRTLDPVEGRGILTKPRWEEGFHAIFIEMRREDTGEIMPTSRRFMADGEMCVEQKAPSGLTIRRWFVRQ